MPEIKAVPRVSLSWKRYKVMSEQMKWIGLRNLHWIYGEQDNKKIRDVPESKLWNWVLETVNYSKRNRGSLKRKIRYSCRKLWLFLMLQFVETLRIIGRAKEDISNCWEWSPGKWLWWQWHWYKFNLGNIAERMIDYRGREKEKEI